MQMIPRTKLKIPKGFKSPLSGTPVIKPNVTLMGRPLPRGAMGDNDGDLMPNVMDCQPNNPRKQGKMGDWLSKKGEQYRDWKSKAPERRQERHETKMKKLGMRKEEAAEKLEIAKSKRNIAEERTATQRGRLELQERRAKMMPRQSTAMPSLGGFDITGRNTKPTLERPGANLSVMTPSPMGITGGAKAPTVKKKRRSRKRKRSKKKK